MSYVKVYTPEEIAAWTAANTHEPPKINQSRMAFWQRVRAERDRMEKAAATRAATRARKAEEVGDE